MDKKFILRYVLNPHWKKLVAAFVTVWVIGLADVLEPWPIKVVLDYVIGSKPMPDWLSALVDRAFGGDRMSILHFGAALVIVIASAGAIASYVEKTLMTRVGQSVMYDIRRDLYHHIQRLSLSYHERHKSGDLVSRVTSDVDAIQDFVSTALLDVAVDLFTLAGMIVVMLFLNSHFTLIAMIVAPLLFVEVYTLTRRIKKGTRAIRKKEGEIVSVVQESLSAIRLVKAFAREDYEENRLKKETLESIDMTLRARKIKARLSPVVDLIVAGGTCVVLWYGARLVVTGQLTSGALVVFLFYLGKMYKPMRDLSKMAETVSKAIVGVERVTEIIKTEDDVIDLPKARRAPPLQGQIDFDHVSFGYLNDRPVLNDLTFRIKPGQFIALVGPTGGGKSTIIGLIPRFYDPTAGSVRIDGIDVRSFTMKSLREQMSFVLQETLLFNASIWQNIAYGKPEATRQEIIRAARLANAHEFIQELPQGYNTVVSEHGASLSGGQRQRIAIARAIIRDSPILILDEPTTGLDAESEQLVMQAIDRLTEGKTSIVIAHRLATISRADVIFVIKEGRILETGCHQELKALGGLYATLCALQLRDEILPGYTRRR
jgi:subfamily B ATP-binding cassette protein MsbA